ncbi:Pleiotropic drug resistance 1 [Chlorella sorokiniana]|uniref:Pleiotropic drug resistance 1 n=1 Tax=Chlorella sorokiniana TaxID=3076 RepID=A0A2P6U314_CHLSO|nr:Pleiotropic drug resistance 1 [Chlorella sorokiniana]|eukprot:PRW60703.1 Pleiotropic drug resistance 1 [Chlorella sorokiniana]
MESNRAYTDPLSVLGLPPTASREDVKAAFRRLALKVHPDVDPSPQAAARFREIKRATDMLLKGNYHAVTHAGPGPSSAHQAWQAYASAAHDAAHDWRPRSRNTALWFCLATLIGGFGVFGFALVSHDWLDGYRWLSPDVANERMKNPDGRRQQLVVLVDTDGVWRVVPLKKIGEHRKTLLAKGFQQAEDEGLGFLRKIRERVERAGLKAPEVEIRWRGLSVKSTVAVTDKPVPGPLDKLVAHLPFNKDKVLRKHTIIDNVNGILKPGRITLLLGTPGSGRSVLMKALSGRLRNEKALKVTYDELSYNGLCIDSGDFVPERSAAYIEQLDEHYGEMTVRETFQFSARVQGGRRERLLELEERERELGITSDADLHAYMAALMTSGKESLSVDVTLRTLGLDICAETLVGNAMLRGISGGQKKRVTAGEMLVGPSQVLFADEISTGLDSATTHDITMALRRQVHTNRTTALVALLQPAPETLDLFDDVMVLSYGQIIFHGPRELVLPFFQGRLGFQCPERKGIAEFLQEVPTLTDQDRFWAGNPADWRFISSHGIADAYYTTTEPGKAMVKELGVPFAKEDVDNSALATTRFGAKYREMWRACMRRGWTLQSRLRDVHIARLIQTVILATLVCLVFLQLDKDNVQDGNTMVSVLFFSVVNFMVASVPDIAIFVNSLPVWWKQKKAQFIPAWCVALEPIIPRLPWMLAETWVWTFLVYFGVGLHTSCRLLSFWGIMMATNFFSFTLGLALAAVIRHLAATMAIHSAFMLVFINTMGFALNPKDIPGGWKGAYWANPLSYFFRGLAANEFTSSDWSQPFNATAGPSPTLGEMVLSIRGLPTSYDFVWLGIFAWGVGSSLINFGICVWALRFFGRPRGREIMTEQAFEVHHHSRAGGSLETINKLVAASRGNLMSLWGEGGSPETVKSLNPSDSPGHSNGHSNGAANGAASGTGSPASNNVDLEGGEGRPVQGGSKLSFVPMCLTFSDVKYSVEYPKGMERLPGEEEGPHAGQLLLLKGISGSFRPGVLTALMGASGAGKTTLMDVLAGRKTVGTITGDIRLNGYPKQQNTFARVSGYCEQTDYHAPFATVLESLQFSARLRLPKSTPADVVEEFVQEVMGLIELTPLKNTMVGNPGSGLSVEQRKRLTIAVEIVANPSIVFMDEPTSGLDARAAGLVMRAIKATVNTGRTVVCTIHQPSLEIFSEFQELLLLKRGGETIYNGPIGADADHLIAYFQGIKGVEPIKPRINPANWMLEVTSPEAEESGNFDFAASYANSDLAEAANAMVANLSEPAPGVENLRYQDLEIVSHWVQTRELLIRNFRQLNRDLFYTVVRAVIVIAAAVVFATLYQDQGSGVSTFTQVLNVAGSIFVSSVFLGVIVCFAVQDVVSQRRTVLYRERGAGIYGMVPYWAAEQLAEVPWIIMLATVYSLIVYWGMGFIADAGKFFLFWLFLILALFQFLFLGMAAVHLTPNLEASNAMAGFSFALVNVFCGFLRTYPTMGNGYQWIYWITPTSYPIYGLVASQLGDVDTPTLLPDGVSSAPVNVFIDDYFGYKHSFIGWAILISIGFIVFFRLVALFAITKINHQSR